MDTYIGVTNHMTRKEGGMRDSTTVKNEMNSLGKDIFLVRSLRDGSYNTVDCAINAKTLVECSMAVASRGREGGNDRGKGGEREENV